MQINTFATYHLVKGQDLNHHGTLYAGRGAEWFVEAGFIAAAALTCPENVVCLKIHGMTFKKPVRKGEIIKYESKIVHTTHTTLIAYVKVSLANEETVIVDGFLTFVHVALKGVPTPHHQIVEAVSAEDIELQEKAKKLEKAKD